MAQYVVRFETHNAGSGVAVPHSTHGLARVRARLASELLEQRGPTPTRNPEMRQRGSPLSTALESAEAASGGVSPRPQQAA